jgi:hypothetical protein
MQDATTETSASLVDISLKRTSLNGCWILDRKRGDPSMKGYLETMKVNDLAIEAHEKGDKEQDTFHTISFENNNNKVTIIKRSRVNNDIKVELELGVEHVTHLPPIHKSRAGDTAAGTITGRLEQQTTNDNVFTTTTTREKKSLALSQHPGHLHIQSSLQTVNGLARVVDVKNLIQEDDRSVMVQELTITNEETGKSHTTIRYFVPYYEIPPSPPHLQQLSEVP